MSRAKQESNKKTETSKRTVTNKQLAVGVVAIVAVLIAVAVVWTIMNPTPSLPTPSASSFTPADWMSFIPANAAAFSYLNTSFLSAQFPTLFPGLVMPLYQPAVNLTTQNVSYSVLMDLSPTNVYAYSIDSADLSNLANTLAAANLTKDTYENVTLYQVNATGRIMWACVAHGGFILADSSNSSGESALESVIDATSSSFFNNDSLKSAYLLTWEGTQTCTFTYQEAIANTYNISWFMVSLTDGSSIYSRTTCNLPSNSVAVSQYDHVESGLLAGNKIYTSGSFLVGDCTYTQSQMSNALENTTIY